MATSNSSIEASSGSSGENPKASKRKRAFVEADVRRLAEFIEAGGKGRLRASDLQEFYKSNPDLDSLFTSRLSAASKLFPHLVEVRSEMGRDYIYSRLSRSHDDTDNNDQGGKDSDENETRLAVKAFGEFLHTVPSKSLQASSLHLFYDKHPDYVNLLSGKFKKLSKLFPDAFVMESPPNGGATVFRAVEASSGGRNYHNGNDEGKAKEQDLVISSAGLKIIVTSSLNRTREWLEAVSNALSTGASGKQTANCLAIQIETLGPAPHSSLMVILTFRSDGLIFDTRGVNRPWHNGVVTECGLSGILTNEDVTKVCYDAARLASLCQVSTPAKVWDVREAARVLGQSAVLPNLGDILQEYEVKVDFSPRPVLTMDSNLSEDSGAVLARTGIYLSTLYSKMWDDAYSRDATARCFRASEAAWNKGLELPTSGETESSRLLRDPNTRKAIDEAKLRPSTKSAAQSVQSRTSAAKRNEALRHAGLPMDACFHFHIATPGYCPQEDSCKFKHQ